jgi:hypothetical protein
MAKLLKPVPFFNIFQKAATYVKIIQIERESLKSR